MALMSVAAFGLIVGHSLTYYRLAPHEAHRSGLLEETGHGYLDTAVSFVGPLAFMSLLFVVLMGTLRARHDNRPTPAACARLMATVQVVGFVLQEVTERMITGATLSDLGPVLAVGLLVQLVVAAVGTLLVVGLHRAGQLISRMIRTRRFARAPSSAPQHLIAHPLSTTIAFGGLRMRGPPVLP